MLIAALLRQLDPPRRIELIDPRGASQVVGTDHNRGPPELAVRVYDQLTDLSRFLRPDLAWGEAYTNGRLTVERGTLREVLDALGAVEARLSARPVRRLSSGTAKLWRALHMNNSIARVRRHVAHHYDIPGEIYDLFLDADRQYSCAYYAAPGDTLETAQARKKRHIAAKLLLEPGQRVLDIGSGWGGLALYLAREFDVEVVGMTLSPERHAYAVERAWRAGLADRVHFRLCDYRHEPGPHDRTVSVGMFEHVGAPHYLEFFSKLGVLVTPAGLSLVHSVGRRAPKSGPNPWLRKYIFPGAYAPSLSETLEAVERSGPWTTDIEILRLHYADTLRDWAGRFAAGRPQAAELLGERFCRMWEFYLAASEMSFRRLHQMVFQLQLSRQRTAVPLTRDYMVDTERSWPAEHALAADGGEAVWQRFEPSKPERGDAA